MFSLNLTLLKATISWTKTAVVTPFGTLILISYLFGQEMLVHFSKINFGGFRFSFCLIGHQTVAKTHESSSRLPSPRSKEEISRFPPVILTQHCSTALSTDKPDEDGPLNALSHLLEEEEDEYSREPETLGQERTLSGSKGRPLNPGRCREVSINSRFFLARKRREGC